MTNPTPRRPRALLFDLGNVCIPFDHGRMVRNLADLFEVPDECIKGALLDSNSLQEIERGAVSEDQLHANLCSQFGRQVDRDVLFRAAGDIFTPNPAMESLLAELSALDLPMVLVSNVSFVHIDYVRREYETLSHFDHLVLSYEVKASKPDAAFYLAAVRAAGCDATECFFIDDMPENVAGATAFGMDAVRFESVDQTRKALTDRGVLS